MKKNNGRTTTMLMIGVLLILALSISGCGKKSSSYSSASTAPAAEVHSTFGETDEELEAELEQVIEDAEADVPVDTEVDLRDFEVEEGEITTTETEEAAQSDDPYDVYYVPTETAVELGGIFVERDGRKYSVVSEVPPRVIGEYGAGYTNENDGSIAFLYAEDGSQVLDIPTEVPISILSVGDFPILTVSKSEPLVGYDQTEIYLQKTDFVGYTIAAVQYTGGLSVIPITDGVKPSSGSKFVYQPRTQIQVVDAADNPVADFRKLTYDETYKLEWFIGTEYNVAEMKANSRAYRTFNPGTEGFQIDGMLSKEGYATFDISGVESGIYVIRRGATAAVFEITE